MPTRTSMRILLSLALVACSLVGLGCGEDEPVSGCRVLLMTGPQDGPVDAPAFLVAGDRRYRLEPVDGGEEGEMFAPGAPDGAYMVAADGWGMLWALPRMPFLTTKEMRPQVIPMGRAGTIYVSARDRERGRVSDEWALARVDTGELLSIQPELTFLEMCMIRVPEGEYQGELRLAGRMRDGALVFPIPVRIERPNLPLLRLASAAHQLPIGVHVVELNGSPRGSESVVIELLDTPLPHRYEQMSKNGLALFPAVADFDRPIRIHLEGHLPPWSFEVEATDVNRRGVYYVHTPPLEPLDPVRLVGPRVGEIDLVQVRGPEGQAYGRLDLRRRDVPEVYVEPGRQHWLVRAGEDWVELDVDVPAAEPREVRVDGFQPGVRVRGRVIDLARGEDATVGLGHRLLFLRVEGPPDDVRLFLGEELDVSVSPQGHYEAHIPAGTYDVRVVRPRGAMGSPARIVVRSGERLSRDFEIGES